MEDAVYLAAIYDRHMTPEMSKRIVRVKMWEVGHSFREIDEMNLADMGDVLSYWREKSLVERKRAAQQARKNRRGKRK